MIDKRLFIRTLVRHSDLVTREASFEYMEIEGERVFLECLQQLEVAFANPEVRRSGVCMYIRMYICTYIDMYISNVSTTRGIEPGSYTVMSGCLLSGYCCYGDHLNSFLAAPVASD